MIFKGKKIEFSIGEGRSQLLICIGISLVIWTFMKLSGDFSTSRHVHVEYLLPPMMEFNEPPQSKLTATVFGSGLSIIGNYIRNPHPTITIDLTDDHRRAVERDEMLAKVEEVLALQVKNLNRSYLSFSLDSMATKRVPVKLDTDITFATDFFPLEKFKLSTDTVTITGTPAQLAEVFEIFSQKIIAHSVDETISTTVPLVQPLDGKVDVYPRTVDVFLPVEQFTEKSFILPISGKDWQDSVRFIPSEAQITCVVGISRFEQLNASDFTIEAIVGNDLEHTPFSVVPVKLSNSPEWVRSVVITPPTVEFYIVK